MAFKRPKARILERSITAGNGPYALAGSVDNSYNTFSAFMAIGDTTYVSVIEPGVAFWTGIATYSAANQITLTTVEEAKGTFGGGTKEVMASALASSGVLREDISGSIITGGTATAYTVASYRGYDTFARMDGNLIGFTPHATNTNAAGTDALLNVDGLGLKPVRSEFGIPLPTGALIKGTPYVALYRHAEQVLYLQGMTNPYQIPLGCGFDCWCDEAPNSAFALAQGQTLSQAVYAPLYDKFGTKYNTGGEPPGTFRIPDKVGRASVMRDAGSTRISSSFFGGNPAVLGAVGGRESHPLSTAQLPRFTPTGTVNIQHGHTVPGPTKGFFAISSSGSGTVLYGEGIGGGWGVNTGDIAGSSEIRSLAINEIGGGQAHNIVQPSIVCNYIIRVL